MLRENVVEACREKHPSFTTRTPPAHGLKPPAGRMALSTSIDADSAFYGRPLVLENGGVWEAMIASHDGAIFSVNSVERKIRHLGNVPFHLRSGLVSSPKFGGQVFAVAETGEIISISFPSFSYKVLRRVKYPDEYSKTGESYAGFFGSPTIAAGLMYVGYVRHTSYKEPPLICFDLEAQSERWSASAFNENEHFGNCRTTPLIINGQVICAFAYTDSLYSFSATSGELLWKVPLGMSAFQQWSSPVFRAPDSIYIGRIDGVISKVSIGREKLIWSRSLQAVDNSSARDISSGDIGIYPGEPPIGGICATPTVAGSSIFVGITSGELFRIQD